MVRDVVCKSLTDTRDQSYVMSGVGTRTVSNRPCSVPFVAFSAHRFKAEELVSVRKQRGYICYLSIEKWPDGYKISRHKDYRDHFRPGCSA